MKPPRLWPGAIFGLIGLNMVVVAVTVYFAASDPSAAIEPHYYQKALAWDDTARARDASARLGWTAAASVEDGRLSVRLTDAAGAPVEAADVRVTAFAVARAADRQALELTPSAPGAYAAPLRLHRAGLWEFRIEARRGDDAFLSTVEQDVNTEPPVAAAGQPGGAAR